MSPSSKPTLADIARMTGLSQAAVSMILNGKSGMSFSEETIRRVHEAAEQIHYRKPGQSGKAAKLFDKRVIAIFCPTVTNPYYSALIQSIEQAARAKKYSTFVFNTYRDPANEIYFLSILQNTDIAGIIFAAIPLAGKLVEEINRSIPVVVIGDRNKEVGVDTVEVDNYKAGVIIAQHLIELGHRHIAYISTTLDQGNTARVKRLEGLQDTFQKECGNGSILVKSREISPQEDLNTPMVEHAVGYHLTKECLPQKKITAFAAVNDMVAYGIIDALESEHYRVPEDYSVCGFDNIFSSQLIPLPLTTVEHHIQEKGHNAFEMLLSRITNLDAEGMLPNSIIRVEYQPRLIVRGTTAPPREESKINPQDQK